MKMIVYNRLGEERFFEKDKKKLDKFRGEQCRSFPDTIYQSKFRCFKCSNIK